MEPSGKTPAIPDFIGNPSALSEAKRWASEWASNKRQPPLLISGPTGTGKTLLAHALALEFGWQLFEFNASDIRDEESVKRLLSHASSSNSLFGGMRLILIDDADSLSGASDRGGAGAIAKILLAARQPIILTAANPHEKKLSAIKAHCTPIELRRAHASSIKALLRKKAGQLSIQIGEDGLEKISQSCSGDIRAALNDLLAQNTGSFRDREKNIFDVVRAILKSVKYSEARQAAFSSSTDHDTLKLWVAQNIPLEYSSPFDIAEAYNSISRADIFDGRAGKTQHFGYLRYSNDLLSSGVALAKAQEYHKYTAYAYPEYLRAMGSTKSSRAIRSSILRKIARACHCSVAQSSSYLQLASAAAIKDAAACETEFGLDGEECGFLAGAKKPPSRGKGQKKVE